MATALTANPLLARLHANRGMLFPLAFISLLFVILVPLPPQMMDLLLVLNLTLSAIVLLTTIYVQSPLEFSVFPSLLLATTLFRLVLNAATTRLILTVGDRSATSIEAQHKAGEVILAFSNFVTGNSLAVGIIIFTIIVVIQFVVITKGATRISEVAARFTLDAMPGKQMAIDADVDAGAINEAEARRRRQEITQEADFYGAMDGASKFVRGDAIAAVLITIINVIGGFGIGIMQRGMTVPEALQRFTLLSIGDGLVAQIPALITSVAAGMLVTRAASKAKLHDEIQKQLFFYPR